MSFMLSASPLARTPLLFATALAMNRAFIRPNPPPPSEQQKEPEYAVETFFTRIVTGLTYFVSNSLWLPALADTCLALHAARRAGTLPAALDEFVAGLPLGGAGVTPRGVAPLVAAGTAVAVCSVLLRRWAMRTLGRHFTLELALQPTHKLVTAPPYNLVRHPSYTGGMGLTLGAALAFVAPRDGWTRSVWLAAIADARTPLLARVAGALLSVTVAGAFALGVIQSFLRPPVEDAMLRARFGADWDRYAQRVRYRLIPFVY